MPQPSKHEEQEWWHADCSRTVAEEMLKRVPTDGAFLVRPSEKECKSYAISFRYVRFITIIFFSHQLNSLETASQSI